MLRFAFAACVAAMLAVGAAYLIMSPPRPEMQVLESNVEEFPVGRRIPGDTPLKLGKGERIKVMLLPSYRTQVLEGPPGDAPAPEGGARDLEGDAGKP